LPRRRGFALALACLLVACEREPEPYPRVRGAPNARPDIATQLIEAIKRPRHPADGGGRAWLERGADGSGLSARVGEPGRFTIVYEAGPLGIARDASLFFQVPFNWSWSPPQLADLEGPGFTMVTSTARGLRLEPAVVDQGLLQIRIRGRALAAGERVRIDYGVGSARAAVDRFAEREMRFFIAVDGNGDGWRDWIADSPKLDVAPGPPARMVLFLPATGRPGEKLALRAALLAENGDAGVAFEGTLRLVLPPGVVGPSELTIGAEAGGLAQAELRYDAAGIVRVQAEGPDGLAAESNPCVVTPDVPRVLFADLHGHSNLSDGTGTPEDYYRYARDVAALDVAALTDHDHWGMPLLDETPANWSRIEEATKRFHEPGRFVTLLGYEWTSWIWGHRHVLHFEDTATIRSSSNERFDSPPELWAALRDAPVLTFAHHSAGAPVAVDWRIAPDPVLEPLTEIASVHGSSESFDSPWPVAGMIEGNTVRDALARGYRLGLVGSGDSHDGHPGLVQLADGASGGLAGVFARDLTRESVLEALRARHVYATNGPRIVLQAMLDGRPMGSIVAAGSGRTLAVEVAAPGPIEAVELVTREGVVSRHPGEGQRSLALESTLPAFSAGDWFYVRVLQSDQGAAWSSPFFFE
jgi:hypothetical protein